MSYGPCQNANEGCPFYSDPPVVPGETNGCRTNEHHIYRLAEAKKLGKTAVQFANLSCHRVNICQAGHQEIEATLGWPPFPSVADMQEKIERHKNGTTGTSV